MKRYAWVAMIAAAIIGAFLLGRFTAAPDRGAAALPAGETDASGSTDSATGNAAGSNRRATPPDSRKTPAEALSGTSVSPANAAAQATGGPRPLLEGDLQRFADMEKTIHADDGVWSDLLELSEEEAQDDDARRLEQLLALAIRRHGDRMTALRLSPPRCTRSACLLRGIGLGQTQNPRSDWQQLLGRITGEPWFRDAFDDMSTTVGSEGTETLYLTLLVRCDPRNCRFGRRQDAGR